MEWNPEGRLAQIFQSKHVLDLERLLETATASKQIYLLVDNLDRNWQIDPADTVCARLIVGLIAAASHHYTHCPIGKTIRPVVFLRDDVRRSVEHADLDMGKRDWMSLTWDAESLENLVAERIRVSVDPGELGATKASPQLWAECFAPEVKGTPTPRFISQRTLMVPRQMIWYCTAALDVARMRGHARIEPEDLVAVEKEQSQRVLKNVAQEFQFSGHDLSVVALWIEGAKTPFTHRDLSRRLRQWASEADQRYTADLEFDLEALLYVAGLLVIRAADDRAISEADEPDYEDAIRSAERAWKSGGGPRSLYRGKRLLHFMATLQRRPILRFDIHPAFRAALEISS